MKEWRKLHVIPLSVALLPLFTFLFTFLWSVYNGHVSLLLPYISDTGTTPPESAIFSLLLNLNAFLFGVCVYVRHQHVTKLATFRHEKVGRILNYVATVMGYIACIGMDIVANFQVSRCYPVHLTGALICFSGGIIYFFLESVLSHFLDKGFERKWIYYCRLSLCFLGTIFLCTAVTASVFAKKRFKGENKRVWRPEDGGYLQHVTSTSAEWLLAVTEALLLLTFLPGFKGIAMTYPRIVIEGISDEY